MKFSELNNVDRSELQERLKAERIKLGKLRFSLANKALADASQLGKTRRGIARLMTALKRPLKSKAQ